MKKILLAFLFITTFSAYSQLDYSLTKSNSTYTEIAGTNVSVAAWGSNHVMAMPFQFKYFGNTYNNVYITFDGCYFSDTGDDYLFYGTDNFMPQNGIPTESPISYLTTGSAPNRIFKMQWKNVKESTVDTSVYEYTLNNQIWLYEGSNIIEYHFGNNSITDPGFNENYIGIIDYDNSPYLAIDSSASNPVLVRVLNAGTFDGIKTYPVNGQIYTLTPKATSVDNIVKPYRFIGGNNAFTIRCDEVYSISVFDVSGRSVEVQNTNDVHDGTYNFNSISPGIYMVNIRVGNQFFTEKFVIR